jgi:hypothetical protein
MMLINRPSFVDIAAESVLHPVGGLMKEWSLPSSLGRQLMAKALADRAATGLVPISAQISAVGTSIRTWMSSAATLSVRSAARRGSVRKLTFQTPTGLSALASNAA